ncbi:MAG: sulfatase-like hydrolase/transferase [Chitinophagaceae bacterium]|nr:sulfatase-like hydrolase/transferase [Chitinophagaceae bacterium]
MKRFSSLHRLTRWILSIALLFLVTMTLMRLGFYLLFNKQGNGIASLAGSFFLGLRFDLRIVAVVVLPLLLFGYLPVFNPFIRRSAFKGWMIFFLICTIALVLFYVIDFAHYAYLSQRLNASALNYLEDAGISATMVWESYPVIKLLLLILAVSGFLIWMIARSHKSIARQPEAITEKRKGFVLVISFIILAFFIFGRFNQYPLRWSDAFSLGNDYKATLALNPFETFFNTLKFRSTSYDEKKLRELYPVIAPYYGLKGDSPMNFIRVINKPIIASPPNIILVICESFSAYKSSMWNNPLNTTPFFDSISKQGIFFDRCFTPSYGTARGVWATITGLPDVDMPKTSSRNPMAVDQHTIINDFKGYEKYYFIGGSPSWANIQGLLKNNIANLHLYDQESLDAPRLDVWGISDKNLFLESNRILAKETKPFFAIIQTADNHRPYTIPEEDKDFIVRKVAEDSLNRFGFKEQVNYDSKLKEFNAFRYTDYTFRKFMTAATSEKYFENTLFVFIGDHGIPGDAGAMFPVTWTQQRLTSEHVPLLFYSPNKISPARRSEISSQIDVLPTIAGLASISYTNSTLGRDLLDSTNHRPFAFIFDPDNSQAGVIAGNFFYRKHLQTSKDELFSIDNTVVDKSNASQDSIRASLKQLTDAFYQSARYLLFNNKKKSSLP